MAFNHAYPYTDAHELNLDWIIQQVTDTVNEFAEVKVSFQELKDSFDELSEDFDDLEDAFEAFKAQVLQMFDDINIQNYVNNRINAMLADGTLQAVIMQATATVSHRNYLDNPFFTVNQRGQSSYTGQGVYSVDRWRIYTTDNVTVSNGLNLPSGTAIGQILEGYVLDPLVGKNVTISFIANGEIKSATYVLSNTERVGGWFELPNVVIFMDLLKSGNNWYLGFTVNPTTTVDVNLRAMKIEAGAASTLGSDTVPDYTTELLKCQRYYLAPNALALPMTVGYAFMTTPVPMKSAPNIEGTPQIIKFSGFEILTGNVTVGGLNTNGIYFATGVSENAYVSFANVGLSADLV